MPKRKTDRELWENRNKGAAEAVSFIEHVAACLESGRIPKIIGTELAQVLRNVSDELKMQDGTEATAVLVRGFGVKKRMPEYERKPTVADKIYGLPIEKVYQANKTHLASELGVKRTAVHKSRVDFNDIDNRVDARRGINPDLLTQRMNRESEQLLSRLQEAVKNSDSPFEFLPAVAEGAFMDDYPKEITGNIYPS